MRNNNNEVIDQRTHLLLIDCVNQSGRSPNVVLDLKNPVVQLSICGRINTGQSMMRWWGSATGRGRRRLSCCWWASGLRWGSVGNYAKGPSLWRTDTVAGWAWSGCCCYSSWWCTTGSLSGQGTDDVLPNGVVWLLLLLRGCRRNDHSDRSVRQMVVRVQIFG